MKKIGIIGSGAVGVALAKGFLKYDYPTMIGSRSTEKQEKLREEIGGEIHVGDFKAAASFADMLVLAVKGTVATDALHIVGPAVLKNKIVMDATNPIADNPPKNGVLSFFTKMDKSLMEELQETFTETKFVKAFSCIGSHLMVNPEFEDGNRPSMFICGNDEAAKKEVTEITKLFGFDTEDMGSAEAARAIEPICILWCIPGFQSNNWMHALKFIR